MAATPRSPTRRPTRRRRRNSNETIQDVAQGQGASTIALGGSANGAAQDQIADVINTTYQSADAYVANGQANVSAPVTVGSEGGGDVTQSNAADNAATATNGNSTGQYVAQEQGASTIAVGGDASAGGQTQDAIVDNWTDQAAAAGVHNGQQNISAPVSVGSGGGGDTTQSNEATNSATASNTNDTIQDVLQGQAASTVALGGSAYGGAQDQIADVINTTYQSADAYVASGQANVAAGTSVGSDGGGDVTQSNTADNAATATNDNLTDQFVTQGQGAVGIGFRSEPGRHPRQLDRPVGQRRGRHRAIQRFGAHVGGRRRRW